MITVHTLASGSSGNASLIRCGDTAVLLDAGISCRRITTSLRELGLTVDDLTAVLITHTHTDHIAGLQTMMKKSTCPIFASEAAARDLLYRTPACAGHLESFTPGAAFALGTFTVRPFAISHDAPGSCGYRLDTEDGSVGLLTDSGYVTEEAAETLSGCDLMLLEANHDVETLECGPYPYYLKQRILGNHGHLSNETAARFAVTLADSGTRELILSHLSRENNTPAMAYNTVERALSAAGLSPRLTVAPRDCLSQAYTVCGRSICRK